MKKLYLPSITGALATLFAGLGRALAIGTPRDHAQALSDAITTTAPRPYRASMPPSRKPAHLRDEDDNQRLMLAQIKRARRAEILHRNLDAGAFMGALNGAATRENNYRLWARAPGRKMQLGRQL